MKYHDKLNQSNKKILVIGSPGAGKSTLTKKMSQISGIPAIHLDALFWQPHWTETPQTEWLEIVRKIIKNKKWIMDGNFSSSFDIRIPTADLIVFLDFPRWICMWRIFQRVLQNHGKVRYDMGNECPEKWDWEFVKYVWKFKQNIRPENLTKLKQHAASKKIITLRKPKEAQEFLDDFATTFL